MTETVTIDRAITGRDGIDRVIMLRDLTLRVLTVWESMQMVMIDRALTLTDTIDPVEINEVLTVMDSISMGLIVLEEMPKDIDGTGLGPTVLIAKVLTGKVLDGIDMMHLVWTEQVTAASSTLIILSN